MNATLPRLFVDAALPGTVALTAGQTNYLKNVLRLTPGAPLHLFNGRDGEWSARIERLAKKDGAVATEQQVRAQTPTPALTYAFAPLKQARLDYMVQKAAEMGAGHMVPVLTQHAQVNRLNLERARANIVEACQQCGVLSVPTIEAPVRLSAFLARGGGALIVADEALADSEDDPIAAIRGAGRPLSVLVGPEGGFDEAERRAFAARAVRVSLGPRVLRADTAAVALLALVEAALPSVS